MKHLASLAALAAAMTVLPGVAQAQPQSATTAKDVNLRAGPSRDYPVVAILPAGYPIVVEGCLPQYTWCDVSTGVGRGWVYAGNINYYYQGSYVPVINYGSLLGIVVLSFVLEDYWGHHYYDQPWYIERHRYIRRPAPPPHFVPPAPAPRPQVQPGIIGPRRAPAPHSPYVRPVPQPQPGTARPQGAAPQPRAHPQAQPQPRVERQAIPRDTRPQQQQQRHAQRKDAREARDAHNKP